MIVYFLLSVYSSIHKFWDVDMLDVLPMVSINIEDTDDEESDFEVDDDELDQDTQDDAGRLQQLLKSTLRGWSPLNGDMQTVLINVSRCALWARGLDSRN